MRSRLGRRKRHRVGELARVALGFVALAGVVAVASLVSAQPGPPPGRGPQGHGGAMEADRELFRQLLDHRQQIHRTVTDRSDAVEGG